MRGLMREAGVLDGAAASTCGSSTSCTTAGRTRASSRSGGGRGRSSANNSNNNRLKRKNSEGQQRFEEWDHIREVRWRLHQQAREEKASQERVSKKQKAHERASSHNHSHSNSYYQTHAWTVQPGCEHRETLGISQDEKLTQSALKNAYRKCVIAWHPDKHIGDRAKKVAEDRFKRIVAAYNALSAAGVVA
eukprot:jgi/Chlat1/2764/Chrsp187S00196